MEKSNKKLVLNKKTVKQIKVKTELKTGAMARSSGGGSGTINTADC